MAGRHVLRSAAAMTRDAWHAGSALDTRNGGENRARRRPPQGAWQQMQR